MIPVDRVVEFVTWAAGGSFGVVVTRYLILPYKVAALQEDVTYVKERIDKLYDALIVRNRPD